MGLRLPPDCHPKICALYKFWDSLRRGRSMPARADFDPLDIPSLLPHLFLIDVSADRKHLTYRVFGTAISTLFRRDLTGDEVGEGILPEQLASVRARYARILQEARPFYHRVKMYEHSNDYAEVDRLILPLSSDGTRIDKLLGMTIARGDES